MNLARKKQNWTKKPERLAKNLGETAIFRMTGKEHRAYTLQLGNCTENAYILCVWDIAQVCGSIVKC